MTPAEIKFDVNTELAARRTGMAFQRTRMAADRTLMAVMRTALSLISFGFTIFQLFLGLRDKDLISNAGTSPRRFGEALVVIGILMLVVGIMYHVHYMLGLRQLRASMREEGLIHGETTFPASLTLITAIALLCVGIGTISSMMFQVGPFN